MRYTRKRLTVKNDGFCTRNKKAAERARDACNRYLKKMSAKGWIPTQLPSAGDCFHEYEIYAHMCHPTTDRNRTEWHNNALESGFKLENGAYTLI